MYQKTIVVGYLGRDPEMRYTPTGVPVTSFTMAHTRKWTNANGEQQEKTTWFRVTVWRKLAEAVNNFLEKGSQVFVEGELRGDAVDGNQNPRIWTGNDGEHRASYEVTARTVKFLGKREGNGGAPIGEPPPGGEDEDLLPF